MASASIKSCARAVNLVAALISYPAGALSDRFGRKNILLASFISFAVAYLGFALATGILVIAGLFVFYGFYEGIFRSVGKGVRIGFCPRASAGWRDRLVQHDRRPAATHSQRYRRTTLGQSGPRRCFLLWSRLCRPRRLRGSLAGSGAAKCERLEES
jgi:hypothetical protein